MADDIGKAARQIWGALDKLAAERPQEYKKLVEEQLKEGKEQFNPPEPSYSLSCKDAIYKDKKYRLHINVCKWARIPYPQSDNDPIPVRGGKLRYFVRENGKKDDRQLVYDVAFNPRVISECSGDTIMSDMLKDLSFDFVEDVTGIKIEREKADRSEIVKGPVEDLVNSLDERLNHLLPKEGELSDSLLEKLSQLSSLNDTTGRLSQLRLSSSSNTVRPLIEVIGNVPNDVEPTKPKYSVKYNNENILLDITLPTVSSSNDIDLEISQDDMELKVDGKYHLQLTFDRSIKEETLMAKFNTKTHLLTLTANTQ